MHDINTFEYRGLRVEIRYSEEDDEWYGKVLDIKDSVTFPVKHPEDLSSIVEEMESTINYYLDVRKNEGFK